MSLILYPSFHSVFIKFSAGFASATKIVVKCNIGGENPVNIRYLEYPLSRTFTMSKFLIDSFSILIKFPYKSVGYLELCYLKLSLRRTIFSVPSVIFGLFPIRYLEHSNEVFEWIILFISGIRILITALTILCSEVCSFFFSLSLRQHFLI